MVYVMSGGFDTAYSLLRFTESGKPRGSLSAAIALMLLHAYLHTTVPKDDLQDRN